MFRLRVFLSLAVIALCCLTALSQDKYEVTASTFLNIRSYASKDAPVIGTVNNGGEVEVYEIADGWAKIKNGNGFAYVSANYLTKVNPDTSVGSTDFLSGIKSIDINGLATGDVKWMVYLIAILSAILWIIRLRRDDDPLEDGLYVTNWIVFVGICVVELIYVAKMGSDTIWFCIPDRVGWMWTVINFILFAMVVYNQLLCLFNTLEDIEYNSYAGVDKRWGIYSWIGGAIGGIVAGIFFPVALPFILAAFVICQIVQIALIFIKIVPEGGFGNALLCFLVYILGTVATVLILVHFLVLLIIVAIGLLMIYVFSKSGERSSRKCCANCNHIDSSGYCSYHHGVVYQAKDHYCENFS